MWKVKEANDVKIFTFRQLKEMNTIQIVSENIEEIFNVFDKIKKEKTISDYNFFITEGVLKDYDRVNAKNSEEYFTSYTYFKINQDKNNVFIGYYIYRNYYHQFTHVFNININIKNLLQGKTTKYTNAKVSEIFLQHPDIQEVILTQINVFMAQFIGLTHLLENRNTTIKKSIKQKKKT
ncbi:MAG: hypothetical protein N4A63_08215 [Vallitalea sp.]|jgi:hypothetical protein|nr:hypothetical protein [Vallitalea sp.]